jgi:pyridoxine 4-dehydrogenase
MTDTTPIPNAGAAGTFTIGGELRVNRLGFGSMQLTGAGVWGDPRDPHEAVHVLRRAVPDQPPPCC